MTTISIRDVSLFVKVIGEGYPLLVMHGGPGVDHSTMLRLRANANILRMIFYDHRCNGRSVGAEQSSMTFENLTADAEALRQKLGIDKWAVLGHSFGGMVALEYALRYPGSLSHLILMDSCGDSSWAQQKAPELLAQRGYSDASVRAARRFFTGQLTAKEFMPTIMKFGRAYYYRSNALSLIKEMFSGGLKIKMRPEAQIFAFSQLLPGWSVMDRLNEIDVPSLVLAGRADFQFPPEHQAALAAGLPNSQLEIIERAGHNPHLERTAEVNKAIRKFMAEVNTD